MSEAQPALEVVNHWNLEASCLCYCLCGFVYIMLLSQFVARVVWATRGAGNISAGVTRRPCTSRLKVKQFRGSLSHVGGRHTPKVALRSLILSRGHRHASCALCSSKPKSRPTSITPSCTDL